MIHDPPLILVVDDEEAGRFVKVQILRRAGFEVRTAETGYEGLRAAGELVPDVIVLDVNLPDISGVEVCSRLREAQVRQPALQILQISNTAISTADKVRGLDHGADVYLTEPVEGDILVATCRALLRVRRAEAALAEALERERAARGVAEDANRMKDEFIATLSHELRTPLNALMGWIWQLRHTTLDADARVRALDSLERNARLQAQLINDLLDISRVSKGKMHLAMQLVDLRTVVEDAVDTVREVARRKHLAVAVATSPGCIVIGDQLRLQQVVTNLLTNAVQFTPERGRLDVTLAADNGSAVLQVRDTGEGIDPAFLPFVFDQFRQGEGGLSRKHGGLGLGLSVVRQLIELHGGRVDVSSEGLGRGTTFTVTMPAERRLGAASSSGGGTPLLEGTTVLIVHPDAHEVAAPIEAAGAKALEAVSPAAARALLRQHRVDVVVADEDVSDARTAGIPVVPIAAERGAVQLVRDVVHAVQSVR